MALMRNTFEGGSSGTAISAANSGGSSGDAFSATGNVVYSNARAFAGSLSAMTPTSATDGVMRWALGGSASVSVRLYVWVSATTTDNQGFIRLSHATDTTALNAFLNGAGALRLSAKGVTDAWTAPEAFPLNQWVRLEMYATSGTTASNGTMRVAYYLGNSMTAVQDSGTLTGLNAGGDLGTFTQARLGKLGATASPQFYFDDFAVNTGSDATGFIGPPVNQPPTVTAGSALTVAPGGTATLSFSATDSDGTIASRSTAITQLTNAGTTLPTLSGGTTGSPSFTVPTGSEGTVYTVTQTVTDNGGATASASQSVYVTKTSGELLPLPGDRWGTGSGVWNLVGGVSSEGRSVSDNTDATYMESGSISSTPQSIRFQLEPSAARSSLSLTLRLSTDLGTGVAVVSLYQFGTLRQTWTQNVTATPTAYTFVVTDPSAISDWRALRVDVTAYATGSA
jgi:hypothetical protein